MEFKIGDKIIFVYNTQIHGEIVKITKSPHRAVILIESGLNSLTLPLIKEVHIESVKLDNEYYRDLIISQLI